MKESIYVQTLKSIESLIEDESDLISVMSTISCELFHAFDYFNWVGFYRLVDPSTLKVGPYQGSHGCSVIDLDRGVCGKCAREAQIQIVNNVDEIECHIACSTETKAEMVLPIFNKQGEVSAVFDIDSTKADVFDEIDLAYLKKIAEHVSVRSFL